MAGAAPAVCTAVGTEDVLCPLHLCVELNRALPWLLGIGLLWLLEPWLMYFTWFWGQWDFSGGRVDFQTIAFQWIDSASLKVNSAGETISTLIPGRELMSGCWCHVSLWMNFSCAASSSTSASPCALAACCVCWHCPALCTPHFYPPSPALLQDMQLPQTLLCGLVAPHEQPCSLCTDPQPWGPLWHGCFVGVLLWEFPLVLKLLWQSVNLHHVANMASLSTGVTVPHLLLNLQSEARSGSEHAPLSHVKYIWSVFCRSSVREASQGNGSPALGGDDEGFLFLGFEFFLLATEIWKLKIKSANNADKKQRSCTLPCASSGDEELKPDFCTGQHRTRDKIPPKPQMCGGRTCNDVMVRGNRKVHCAGVWGHPGGWNVCLGRKGFALELCAVPSRKGAGRTPRVGLYQALLSVTLWLVPFQAIVLLIPAFLLIGWAANVTMLSAGLLLYSFGELFKRHCRLSTNDFSSCVYSYIKKDALLIQSTSNRKLSLGFMQYERNGVWVLFWCSLCHRKLSWYWEASPGLLLSCLTVDLLRIFFNPLLADLEEKYSLNSSAQEKERDMESLHLSGVALFLRLETCPLWGCSDWVRWGSDVFSVGINSLLPT